MTTTARTGAAPDNLHPHEWKVAGLATPHGESRGGMLLGIQMQPRDIAAGLYLAGFHDTLVLGTAVAVCLSESQGYTRAFNDNVKELGTVAIGARVRNAETGEPYLIEGRDLDGSVVIRNSSGIIERFPPQARVVTSRDVGLMQINIPATDTGSAVEEALYDPVTNFGRAFALWQHRGFQPWVGFSAAVYLRDTYVKRATRGVGNWIADGLLTTSPTDTLAGQPYEHTLKTPILDYTYRVVGMHNALLGIERIARHKPVSIPQIELAASTGAAIAKS